MNVDEATAKARDEEIEEGSFIEMEVTGEVVKLSPRGAMRIARSGYRAESMVSGRHIMESDLKPGNGPIEARLVLRGYFELWSGSALYLSGNGTTSRIAVYHIVRLERLDRPTLPNHDDIRASG